MNKNIIKQIFGYAFLILYIWLLFFIAGRWDWWEGWIYVGVLAFGYTCQILYNYFTNPDTMRHRGEFGEGTKDWDKVMLALFGLSFVAIPVVGAFDSGRYLWASMPEWLIYVGSILFIIHICLFAWAVKANTFFEKTVRIQKERDHHVVDSGPYRFVRHPGYASNILGMIGMPLILGSWWAFVPAGLATLFLLIRTVLEDRVLREELTGYEEYAGRVRRKLIPGIW
jgi:protein-S-isoprenylcysteine O-methyltransferase Ste14